MLLYGFIHPYGVVHPNSINTSTVFFMSMALFAFVWERQRFGSASLTDLFDKLDMAHICNSR